VRDTVNHKDTKDCLIDMAFFRSLCVILTVVSSVSALSRQPPSYDCYKDCNKKSGLCESYPNGCGDEGFCCKFGHRGCAGLKVKITLHHYCVYKERKVCYPPYGCFSGDAPFTRPFVPFPRDPKDLGTKLLLHTRKTWSTPERKPIIIIPNDKQSIIDSGFDASKPTTVYVHGFMESSTKFWTPDIFDAFLKSADMNMIFVDWTEGAKGSNYLRAIADARVVGAEIGFTLKSLHEMTGLDMTKVHILGFSLGAHTAGYAGEYLRKSGHTIARLTGLDPAGPYFENTDPAVRLDPTDATYVDVVHTDTRTVILDGVGAAMRMGHVDFYPNGGYYQPGCKIGGERWTSCGHERAVRYFLESINSKCLFTAKMCNSYEDYKNDKCEPCTTDCRRMGYFSNDPSRSLKSGKYFLQTNAQAPYCIH